VFESLVILGDKCLRSNDPRIREIARAIPESLGPAHIKFVPALFFQHLFINYAGSALIGTTHGPRLIHIPAVAPQSFRCIHNAEFDQPKIERKKPLLIVLLDMISQRVPPVLLRAGNDAGANQIEIDIRQAVYQGLAVFNNAAFKPFAQSVPNDRSSFFVPYSVPIPSLTTFEVNQTKFKKRLVKEYHGFLWP